MRKLLTAVSLAVMLALGAASISSQALADEVVEIHLVHMEIHKDDSWTEVWEDKDGGLYFFDYDKDGNRKGNPNPEGGSSSTQSSQDLKDAIAQALQNGGGSIELQMDFFNTPVGKALVETGKTGSIVPYHNPADSLTQDFDGGYGAGKGGIDLNGGSIAEQIKQHGSKKKKDDGDDDGEDYGTGNPGTGDDDLQFGGASADMELVNPVPVDRPVAKSPKKTARQASPQAPQRGLPSALARRSILDGGPSLLPAGPSATGTALGGGAGSPLGSTLR